MSDHYHNRSVRTTKPETSFGRTKDTAGALIQFSVFIILVLVIFAIAGGFADW